RVEPEVDGVVAQEALRVHGPGQVAVVARLEGAQVAHPDLGVALGPDEVDALVLARRGQPIRQARSRVDRVGPLAHAEALRRATRLIAGGHASIIPGVAAAVP